ncbi:MAG: sortase [Clostridia bacterium]|nr:sortase [Clostridia bacterium]
MKRKIGIAFMASGLVLLVTAAALLFYNNFENKRAEDTAEVIVDSLMGEIEVNRLEEIETDPFDTEMKVAEIDGYGYIGYLYIPALNLELPVMDKWDYNRLKISPCRYYGSTKTDNLVIAAHNYRSHFKYLGQLKPDDTVMFADIEGNKHTYRVSAIETLKPTDVEKVKDTGDDLILYTCTYSGNNRIIVRCFKTA